MNLSKLFGSKCRVKILEKLVIEESMGNHGGFFIRELCRDIEEQINSVRRELMNLEELGILRSYDDNKKKFYTLNPKSPIFSEMRGIFLKNYNPIEPIKEYFKGKKTISLIAISQSIFSFENDKPNTLVDIFIIGKLDKIEFNTVLERIFFGRKIKYALMSEEDFQERVEYGDKLVFSILEQKDISFLKDKLDIEAIIEARKRKRLLFD